MPCHMDCIYQFDTKYTPGVAKISINLFNKLSVEYFLEWYFLLSKAAWPQSDQPPCLHLVPSNLLPASTRTRRTFGKNNLQHSDRHFNLVLLMQSRMVCRPGCPYPWPSTTCDTPSGAICPQSPSVKRSIEPDNYLLSLIGTRFLRDVHVPAERLGRSEHKMLIVIHGGHAAPVWALMSR